MAEADPSFHIREQIAQMETEILQHELLIRRQKHVLNSIKQMIPVSPTALPNAPSAIPQRVATAPSSAISRLINQAGGSNQAKAAAPSVASSGSSKKQPAAASTRPPTAPAAAQQKTNGTTQASAKQGNPYLLVRGPAVRQKKRAAMSKVAEFCKIIPKFGTAAPPKRKRTSKEMAEATEATEPGALSQPVSMRKKRRSLYQEFSDEDEDEEDALLFRNNDIQTMLSTAQAKLQSFCSSGRSSGSMLQPPARAPMQVVNLQQLSGLAPSSGAAGTSSASKPASSRPAASAVSKASSASSQSFSASAGPSAGKTGAAPALTSGVQAPGRVAVVPGKTLTSSSSAHPASARSAEALTAARLVQPAQSPLNARALPSKTASSATATATALASSRQVAAPPVPVTTQSTPVRTPVHTSSAAALIGSNSKLLSGSAHKALDVIEHCRRQTALEDRLEIAKDLHANILSNPRRLQHLLDSAGGRDLFISWLQEAMDALSASAVAVVTGKAGAGKESKPAVVGREEEMRLSKLVEYCVLLVNQAYWDAKSVSDLRFDKTLKNLYRLYEFKQEAHQVTVSNIVKGIWPSYRIMRKQHEGKSKSSAVLIQ